jgi:large subunit ribosomal protein L24
MDIRKGDSVQVISGNDKGRRSTVLNVFKERGRVIIEGVNMRKHHTRPTSRDPQGGIIEREAPIHISNIMVVCPKTDQPTRIGHKQLDNGKHVRVSTRSGEMIDPE